MDSEKLTISLLGPPLITLRGKPLQIKRRKVRFLLYYLACQEFAVSRSALCDIFWPDQSEPEARKNLREALSNLRSAVNSEEYFSVQGEFISLNEDRVQVDVRDFEKIITLLRKNLEISLKGNFSEELYLKVRAGINLWRTPGFIAGALLAGSEGFQKWAIEKNDSLEYWRQMMLEWTADQCIASGNLSEALEWLSQALLYDKYNTELNFLVLTCLRDLGAWSELLHFCDMLESIYQENDELPLPHLLQHSIWQARALATNLTQEPKIIWKNEEGNQVHFVDTNQRITVLRNHLHIGGMVLIRGGLGSGKSRLLREFINSLEVAPRLIYLRSSPGDELISYLALVEGLKDVVADEEWRALEPIYAKALFPLFPFIDKIRNDINSVDIPFSIGLNRLIPEAFLALFTLISHNRRVLYVLDNAQWCDADTLRVFSYVHERGGPENIGAVVLAARPEIRNSCLDNMFLAETNNRHKNVILITPLSVAEISEIVFFILGAIPSPEESAWLLRESGGNPGLLIEMLKSFKENRLNLKELMGTRMYPVASSLQMLIEDHLYEISETDRGVLSAAAVLQNVIRADVLEELTGIDAVKLIRSVKELQEKGILRVKEEISPPGGYEFVHGVIRNYILERMDPLERRLLHQQALLAIQKTPANTPGIEREMAWHYEAAGDFPNALQCWLSAAKQALNLRARADTFSAFRSALALCLKMGNNCPGELFLDLINNWTDYAFDIDDEVVCEELFSICLQEGESRKDERMVGLAYSGLAWVQAVRGNLSRALESIELALNLLAGKDHTREYYARARLRRGIIYNRYGDFVQAIVDFEWAQASLQAFSDEKTQQFFKNLDSNLIFAYCQIGEIQKARVLADKSLQHSQAVIDRTTLTQVEVAMVFVHYASGEFLDAINLANSIEDLLVKLNIKWWYVLLKTIMAQTYFELGEVAACRKILSELEERSQDEPNYRFALAYIHYLQGELYRELGDTKNALSYYQKGLQQQGSQYILLLDRLGISLVHFAEGKVDQCRIEIDAEIEDAQSKKFRLLENKFRAIRLQLFQEKIDDKEFGAETDEIEQIIRFLGQKALIPNLTFIKGICCLQRGNISEGLVRMEDALREAQEMNLFWLEIASLDNLLIYCRTDQRLGVSLRLQQNLAKLSREANDSILKTQVKNFISFQKKLLK